MEDNRRFAEEHGFPFPLLCDPEQQVGRLYEVTRPDDDPLAQYGVPLRITYLIDPDGTIAAAWEVSDVHAHPEEVLAELRRRAS